jgi:hypothetical protein
MTSVFDPYFDERFTLDSKGAVTKTEITAAEDIALLPPDAAATSAPTGFRGVPVASTGDLIVRADRVRVVGTIKLPGRAVQINARVFEFDASDAKAPSIDVSGDDGDPPDSALPAPGHAADGRDARGIYHAMGKDEFITALPGISGNPGADGAQGHAGKSAGWIDLRVGSIRAVGSVTTLRLRAAGGQGGAGQDGQPGQPGGRGGNGMDGWVGGIFLTNDVWEATDGANAGAPGANGRGGWGGFGGSGGSITVSTLDASASAVAAEYPAGGRGADGAVPNFVVAASPGTGGAGAVVRPPGGYASKHADGKDGGMQPPIAQPPQAAPVGDAPKDGSASLTPSSTADELVKTAAADQLTVLLDRVRVDRLALQGGSLTAGEAADLGGRLAWLTALSGAPAIAADRSMAAVSAGVSGIAATMSDPSLDAFGHSSTWVPTVSLPTYRDLLENQASGSLVLLQNAEKAWHDYRDARDAAVADSSQRSSAVQVGASQLAAVQKRRDALGTQLGDLARQIDDRRPAVDAARQDVLGELASFKKNVENHVTINLDLSQVLDVLEQTAFASVDPDQAAEVAGLETAKAAMKDVDISNVEGADGQAVSKKYICSRLDVYGKQVKSLDEAYSVVQGRVTLDDPDGYKLLCTQQQLDDLLSSYEVVPGAVDAQDAMDAYVREVLGRNSAIMQYNATAADYAQAASDAAALAARQRLVEADAAKVDAPVFDNYVERLYSRAREVCLHDLYMASRAYRFWALHDDTAIAQVITGGVGGLTFLAAQSAANGLLAEHADDLAADIGDLTSRKDPVVLTFVAADRPSVVKSFSRDRGEDPFDGPNPFYWEFKVRVASKGATQRQSAFAGMKNVRLSEIRVWLVGLDSAAGTDGSVKVHVTHQGEEDIVHPDGTVVHMSHDPVERVFEYRTGSPIPGDGAIEAPLVYWDQPRASALPDHTPIGPFATWRVAVRPQDAVRKIDWKALSQVQVEFFVRYQ